MMREWNKELETVWNSPEWWSLQSHKWSLTDLNGKSRECKLVLVLMDTDDFDNDYCGALDFVMGDRDRIEVEIELNKYI